MTYKGLFSIIFAIVVALELFSFTRDSTPNGIPTKWQEEYTGNPGVWDPAKVKSYEVIDHQQLDKQNQEQQQNNHRMSVILAVTILIGIIIVVTIPNKKVNLDLISEEENSGIDDSSVKIENTSIADPKPENPSVEVREAESKSVEDRFFVTKQFKGLTRSGVSIVVLLLLCLLIGIPTWYTKANGNSLEKSLSGESHYWTAEYHVVPGEPDEQNMIEFNEHFKLMYKSERSGGQIDLGGGYSKTLCGNVAGFAHVDTGGIVEFDRKCTMTADDAEDFNDTSKYALYIWWKDSIVPMGSTAETVILK